MPRKKRSQRSGKGRSTSGQGKKRKGGGRHMAVILPFIIPGKPKRRGSQAKKRRIVRVFYI